MTLEPHEKRNELDEQQPEVSTGTGGETLDYPEALSVAPPEISSKPSEGEQPEAPQAPLTVDDIPTSTSELRSSASGIIQERIERARSIGAEPIKEMGQGIVDRALNAFDSFFDKWEGKK